MMLLMSVLVSVYGGTNGAAEMAPVDTIGLVPPTAFFGVTWKA